MLSKVPKNFVSKKEKKTCFKSMFLTKKFKEKKRVLYSLKEIHMTPFMIGFVIMSKIKGLST
jgi:hypothetical protein